MYNQRQSQWILLILLCCFIALIGCASQIPVGKFETLVESSQSVFANTIDTYARVEKLQRLFAVITAPDSNIDRNTFKPQIEGQSFDLAPELRFREAAFDVLVKYVVVLQGFSSKEYKTKVDKASQQLAGSLNNMIGSSKIMKGSTASTASGILATIVDIVGSQLVKRKRIEGLKEVMDLAQNDIEKLSRLIVGSNTKIKSALEIMFDRIIAHANEARPFYGTADRYWFDLQIADIITEVEEIKASLESMNTSILKIPEAHKEIRSLLDKQPVTLQTLQDLVEEAQRTSKFYRNLK